MTNFSWARSRIRVVVAFTTMASMAACFPPALDSDTSDVNDIGPESDTGSYDEEVEVLEAPQGLTASTELDDRVRLLWSPVAGAAGYHVYRDGQRLTARSGLTVTTYDDLQAPAVDDVWQAPAELEASSTLTDRIEVTWRSPSRPVGPEVTYQVVALASNVEGASSTAVGRRAALPIERFEVEYTTTDGMTTWVDTASLDHTWGHRNAPKGRITLDGFDASRGDFASRVKLSARDVGLVAAATVTYRVRGVLQGGGHTPLSQIAVGQRAVGGVTFDWQWSSSPAGPFISLGQNEEPDYDDADPPADGSARYYRVEVQAEGSDSQLSDVAQGWRLLFVGIAIGSNFACGTTPLEPDGGRVWCWGGNEVGQLGNATGGVREPQRIEGLSGITKVVAAIRNACALDLTGNVTCWGAHAGLFEASDMRPHRIDGITGARDIGLVGSLVACAATETRVLCWGKDFPIHGLLGDGTVGSTRLSSAEVVDATSSPIPSLTFANGGSGYHHCGRHDSEMYCWGRNSSLELGPNAPASRSPHAVNVVIERGPPRSVAVSFGATCGLWDTGVYCWGAPFDGGPNTSTPRLIDSAGTWQAVYGGGAHFCVLGPAGMRCVGENQQGQLGTGTILPETAFTPVRRLSTPTVIALGAVASCAIEGGVPWCWGYNGEQILQVESTDTVVLEPSRVRLPE